MFIAPSPRVISATSQPTRSLTARRHAQHSHLFGAHEGHLLNWYNIETLDPLQPRYVSAVDSGNLLASLWTLKQGLRELTEAPLLGSACLRGLSDTLSIAGELVAKNAASRVPRKTLESLFTHAQDAPSIIGRVRLAAAPVQRLAETLRWIVSAGKERDYWVTRLERNSAPGRIGSIDICVGWKFSPRRPMNLSPCWVRRCWRRGGADSARKYRSLTLACRSVEPLNQILSLHDTAGASPKEHSAWLDTLRAEFERSVAAAAETIAKVEMFDQRISCLPME